MTNCPGCLKSGHTTYCGGCRKRLFNGKEVPFVLPFSRPAYNQVKLTVTTERMSISGIQTKISLALRERRLEMTESGGQYILKPIPPGEFQRLEVMPINEHLTMQIARQVFAINTAENALVSFEGDELAYLVRRFDVQPDGTRSLQEDFAQIAGKTEENAGRNYKYDYSYEGIGNLIRRHVAASRVDLEAYFKLVLFNYLIHNGDTHLKNFSLIRDEQTREYRLAPAYDLLNTRLHLPGESRTALDLFDGDFETESFRANAFYAYDDFLVFAQRLGLMERRAKRILQEFIDRRDKVLLLIERSPLTEECKRLYRGHVEDRLRAISHSHSGLR